MKNKILIFVYGTLMKGHRNQHYLEQSKLVGKSKTKEGIYHLIGVHNNNYPYPGLKKGGNKHICGEIYEICPTLLPALDKLEDLNIEYTREHIVLENGLKAWTYFYMDNDFAEYCSEHPYIKHEQNTSMWDIR